MSDTTTLLLSSALYLASLSSSNLTKKKDETAVLATSILFLGVDFFVQFMCGMKNGGVATLIITLVVIVLKSFPFCETSWYFWVLYCFMRIFESAYLLHWLLFLDHFSTCFRVTMKN